MTRERLKTCPTCKTPFVEVPADERAVFDLPAIACTCALAAPCAALALEGFVLGDDTALAVARKAKWPKRYGPVQTIAVRGEKGRPSRGHLVVKPFVAPFIVAAVRVCIVPDDARFGLTEEQVGAKADFLAALLRSIDADQRGALNAAVRIGGDDVVRDMLFAPLRDAAGAAIPETPTSTDRMRDAMARLLRGKGATP